MAAIRAQLEQRAKAVAGAVFGALVAYAATAIQSGTAFTARGAELAAVAAVVAGLGVHQAPKNKDRPKKR